VTEARGHLGLAHRAAPRGLPFGRIQQLRPDDLLYGHVPVEQFVARPPDRAHPATANDGTEPVPPGQDALRLVGRQLVDRRIVGGHRPELPTQSGI
jgi:hypothetical protein